MTCHVGDRRFLLRAIQMVKLKDPRRISLSTIDTGFSFLSSLDGFSDNLTTDGSRSLGLLYVLLLIRLIMLLAVGRLARNTIGLPAMCSFRLEDSERHRNLTSGASPFVHI